MTTDSNGPGGSPTAAVSPGSPAGHVADGSTLRKVTIAASIGSAIEYFDLVIYGAMASVLANVFFPGDNDTAKLLNTFAVFALAFLARPLGGLLWGPLGDKIGRKRTLGTIIVVMALATAGIGLLPGYASIGILAPLGLVLLRFIQGISAGGEMPGAATFVAEHSPDNRRAYQSSFLQWAVTTGQISALLVATLLVTTVSAEDMRSWGWRVPFLLALPVGAIGLYIRSRVEETPLFDKIEEKGAKVEHPIKSLLGTARGWKMLGRSQFFNLPASIPAYLLLTFMPAWLVSSVHLTRGQALTSVTIAVVAAMVMQPIGARASDRFGRRPLLFTICVAELILAYPAFMLLHVGGHFFATAGLVLIGVVHGLATGCQAAPTLESFPTKIRYTGYALSLGLSTALLAGPTPYVATWLISITGSSYAPAWMIMICAVPALIGVFFIRETSNRPLPM